MNVINVFVDGKLMPKDSYTCEGGEVEFIKPLNELFPEAEKEHKFWVVIEGKYTGEEL